MTSEIIEGAEMTDDELEEKVAQEIDPHACWIPTPNWTIAPDIAKAWQDAARVKARAILSIARPIIEREALEKAAACAGAFAKRDGWIPKDGPITRTALAISEAIRALTEQDK